MKKIYTQPRVEIVATTPQHILCGSGSIQAQISGYNQNTGGGFSQTYVWLAGVVCSSLLFLGTACSTTNNPDQPKQQAELKPRTLVVTQQAVSRQPSAVSIQHSAVSIQHSAVSKVTPASAVSRQHSAVSIQHSAVSIQPSAVRRLPQATITENGDVLDAIWSRGDEISFRNLSHETYTPSGTTDEVPLDGVLLADKAARVASFASNDKVWCELDDQILLVYPKAAAPAFSVEDSPLRATYTISLIGQDGTLATIANRYHHSYGIAKITEVTPTVANAEVAEMQNLLTVCKFSFVDKDEPGTLLPITSLSISYGDGTYANTYPGTAGVTVTQGTTCTVTVTPDKKSTLAGGNPLAISPSDDLTEVYVALLPEATATTYSFSLESGENTYTGTATARLIAGEYVVATNLKLTKVNP